MLPRFCWGLETGIRTVAAVGAVNQGVSGIKALEQQL